MRGSRPLGVQWVSSMRKLLLLIFAAIMLAGAPVSGWAQNHAVSQTQRRYKAKKYNEVQMEPRQEDQGPQTAGPQTPARLQPLTAAPERAA